LLKICFASFVMIAMAVALAPARSAHTHARPTTASSALSQAPAAVPRTLVVGTRVVPPFAFKDKRGEWQGISIDLWRDIAGRLRLDYRFEEAGTVKELIDGVASKKFDAGVAALTVTEERERRLDFSHPFFSTGLAIATAPSANSPVWSALAGFMTWEMLAIVAVVFAAIVAVGVLIWLVERRTNAEIDSAGEGFWASLSMLLTSQFTEPEPKSAAGRTFAALWVVVSIVLMTFFTGVVTTALTVQSLQGRVRGVSDLPAMRVGAVTGSTGFQWLSDERIHAGEYANVADGLEAVVAGKIDALVYDAPVLQYLAKNDYGGRILVLPDNFAPQDYAIALPEGSTLRRQVNQELLAIKSSEIWKKRIFEYLGER
jgi:polar amino acid transport system substrate-binding protein